MRLGYLSLPPELTTPVRQAQWIADNGSSLLLQRMVAHLMTTGEYERHIRRMSRRYRARRDALLHAFERHLGADATVEGSAGLHVAVWLPGSVRTAWRISSPGARPAASASTRSRSTPPRRHHAPGLVLGFGLLEPAAIESGIATLADVYREIIAPATGRSVKRR